MLGEQQTRLTVQQNLWFNRNLSLGKIKSTTQYEQLLALARIVNEKKEKVLNLFKNDNPNRQESVSSIQKTILSH